MSTLTFLGATGTVTGSKYLLEAGGERLLIDCGLFQGEKELRLRNWNPLPIPASSIHWLVLTHAHLDHTGYIPRPTRLPARRFWSTANPSPPSRSARRSPRNSTMMRP
jgi:metallo-beta-lactamase family protein